MATEISTEISATFSKMRHFSKKNVINHNFEGSVEKKRGSRGPNLFFNECALVNAQTW